MFKKWIIKLGRKWEDQDCPDKPVCTSTRISSHYEDESVINFRLYGASGGKIIEASRYNQKTQRETTSRYVIPDGEDLTHCVSNIITMEHLR